MVLKLFKLLTRWVKPAGTAPADFASTRPGRWLDIGETLPLPEVVEGNQETDWTLWEESVALQASQTEALPTLVKQRSHPLKQAPHEPIGL